MIKEAIVKIVNKGDLSYEEAYAVMNEIMSGETTPTQNAAFLAALSTKSARAETTDEIAGCAAAMRDHATRVDTGMDVLEIVGTGGDNAGIIDLAQLHGHEDEAYLSRLRSLTDRELIQAFRIRTREDVNRAAQSSADHLLLDAGAGEGAVFDWSLLRHLSRPYVLAGGLDPENVGEALGRLHPFGVDVSSGIETNGQKNPRKMAKFVRNVRKEERT
jgi:phosphoribosylanthranilate isomerase